MSIFLEDWNVDCGKKDIDCGFCFIFVSILSESFEYFNNAIIDLRFMWKFNCLYNVEDIWINCEFK